MISRILKYLNLDLLLYPLMKARGWYSKVSPLEITCREVNDLIYDHVEGTLPEKQTVLLKRHTRTCPICRNFLKTYIATYKAESHVIPYEHIDTPNEMPQDLINAILNEQKNKNS